LKGGPCLIATLLAAGLSIGPLATRGPAGGGTEPGTSLGTNGTRFTVNDRPTFLFGLSYYGALGASDETVRRDLADLQKHGFNWVRVWATWAAFGEDVSAVDGEGKPREGSLKRLERLVAACDEQGVVVDVTLSRGNGSTGPARIQSLEAHRRAVETLVTALKVHRNWYLDLANERNVKDRRFTPFADLRELRELVRKLDPHRLVTASHAGDVSRADLGEYLQAVRVDFLSPHRPRTADSGGQTEARSREYLAWMKELGREVPLHYQEPFRRDFGTWQPRAEDYVTDLKGALAGGAAGWCWHNGDNRAAKDGQPRRSFDLRDKRLFAQMDEEEGRALPLLSRTMAGKAGVEGQDKPATPVEQYQAILKDYQMASTGGDGTDEGRRRLIARLDQLRPTLAQRFLDLAEQHPTDPVAMDALTQAIWMVNHNAFPAGGKDSPGARAMALLLRDHLRSDKLGPICLRLSAGFRKEHETFLRTLLERSPHRDVRGLACLALAQFLNNRLQRLDQIKEQPDLAQEYDALFGKEFLTQLRRQDRARVAEEIETLFEHAGKKYGDVKIPYEGTVAQKVRAELFEFRHLLVGKQAPDIEGVDQDGQRFKLSDYKGKVVLLDFWHQY
jgi:hypothetical protein